MAQWSTSSRAYRAFNLTGSPTGYYAFLAVDEAQQERSQVVLIERPDNEGPSLNTDRGKELAIEDFASKAQVDPMACDWFRVDDEGKMQGIDVSMRPEEVANPTFSEIERRDGFARASDREAALKAYPPIEEDRVVARDRPVEPDQGPPLMEAFPDGFDLREYEGPKVEQANEPAPEVDRGLADMYFEGTREVEGLNPAQIHGMEPDDGMDP